MKEVIENVSTDERAVLVGLAAHSLPEEDNATEESMDELAALLETAGGACVAQVLQVKQTPDPRTLIGAGKVAEVKELAEQLEAKLVVFDNELSPSQLRALEKDLDLHVMDRANLILDIFAKRASTSEGRLQVELAQYKYLLPRLTGMWTHLVRQTASGGKSPIGTRGPGETQLETDRRHIRRKIAKLEEDLEQVRKGRAVQRQRRLRNEVPVVAIVGYTNAGKSTLLNALTGADIPANDRLFDTLDTTTRHLKVSDTMEVLLSDTVGFIRKLPHHLVDAFRATLEELSYADLLLNVTDVSDPEWREKMDVTMKLIAELKAEETPVIHVYNKADLCRGDELPAARDGVRISAKEGRGLDTLLAEIEKALSAGKREVEYRIPYSDGGVVQELYDEAQVLAVDYQEDGILVRAISTGRTYGRLRRYIPGAEQFGGGGDD